MVDKKVIPDRPRQLRDYLHTTPLSKEAGAHRQCIDRCRRRYNKLAQDKAAKGRATRSTAALHGELLRKKQRTEGERLTRIHSMWLVGSVCTMHQHHLSRHCIVVQHLLYMQLLQMIRKAPATMRTNSLMLV